MKSKKCALTLRDTQILLDLYTAKYMTAVQIQALHWRPTYDHHTGPERACQRRLRQLYDAGLVRRIEPRIRVKEGKKPLIYALAQGGAQVLSEQCGIDPATLASKPHSREENYPFLQHLLDTTAIRIAVTYAAERAEVNLETWRNELELKSEGMTDVIYLTDPDGTTHKTAVVPDAVAVINRAGKQAILLFEIDRSTVTVNGPWAKRNWARKVRQYLAYFDSAAYQQRYGEVVAQVMTITTGAERLAHLKAATEKAGGGKRFWFTTFEQAKDPENILTKPIWTRAGIEDLYALLR